MKFQLPKEWVDTLNDAMLKLAEAQLSALTKMVPEIIVRSKDTPWRTL